MAVATLTIIVALTTIGILSMTISLCCINTNKQYAPTQPTQLYYGLKQKPQNINKKNKELEHDIAFVSDFLDENLELGDEIEIE